MVITAGRKTSSPIERAAAARGTTAEILLGPEPAWQRFLRLHRGKLHLVAFLGAVALATPRISSILAALPLVAIGLVWRAWAAGYIDKDLHLCTTGPYAYCRHPMYLGNLVVLVSLCIAAHSIYLAVAGLLVGVLVYHYAIRQEERLLHRLFGQEFEHYSQHTPPLVPRLTSHGITDCSGKRFSWYLAAYNSIWVQSAAVVLLVGLFAAKAIWLF